MKVKKVIILPLLSTATLIIDNSIATGKSRSNSYKEINNKTYLFKKLIENGYEIEETFEINMMVANFDKTQTVEGIIIEILGAETIEQVPIDDILLSGNDWSDTR